MPRRSARATQDDIEVDEQEQIQSDQDPVQSQAVDSEEDAPPQEQKPLARSKKANATKSKSKTKKTKTEKRRKPPTRDEEEAENEDSDAAPPFDRLEFLATARPIPKTMTPKISGMMDDWGQVLHQVELVGFPLVMDTAIAVEEVAGNTEDGKDAVDDLDVVMRQLIDAQYEFNAHQDSLKSLTQRIATGETIEKLEDQYTSEVQTAMEMYHSRTTRQKYAKHESYFKFRDRVWEVNHKDAMPPLGDLIAREEADSEADSDIEIGGMTQDYRCPISLRELIDPLTSRVCEHSYDADTIRHYLKDGPMNCPANGCNKTVKIADLQLNEELAKRTANFVRRERLREEASDESEAELVD